MINWYRLITYSTIVFVGCLFWYAVISRFVEAFSK
jgi:hypothetical protein